MDIQVHRKRARVSFCFWLVSYLIWLFINRFYNIIEIKNSATLSSDILSMQNLLGLFIVFFYFFPLLFWAHHNAKLAKMRTTGFVTKILLVIHILWIILNFGSIMFALVI